MPRRIPKDAMTRALEAAGADDELPTDRKAEEPAEGAAEDSTAPESQEAAEPAAADEHTAEEDAAEEDAAEEDAADESSDAPHDDDPDSDDPDSDEDDSDEEDDEQDEAMADVPDKLYFRIGEVAQLVGVDAHVLRYWESEFRMKPHRSSSGQRLYRKKDLSRFFRIKRLLHDEGYTIAGARKVLSRGKGRGTSGVDASRIREALGRVQTLRDRILELRDDLDPEGRF